MSQRVKWATFVFIDIFIITFDNRSKKEEIVVE
jgi:hypothetical protein